MLRSFCAFFARVFFSVVFSVYSMYGGNWVHSKCISFVQFVHLRHPLLLTASCWQLPHDVMINDDSLTFFLIIALSSVALNKVSSHVFLLWLSIFSDSSEVHVSSGKIVSLQVLSSLLLILSVIHRCSECRQLLLLVLLTLC